MARVLLLTPAEQSADVAFLLEEEGHEPLFWPLLGAPLATPPALRAAAEQLGRFNWVVITNRPVLRVFLEAVTSAGSRSSLQRVRWLAGDAPNLAEARDAIEIIIGNSRRAADILVEVRDLVDTPLSAPICGELDGQAAGMASSGWGALRQNLGLAWQRLRSNRLLLAGSIQ